MKYASDYVSKDKHQVITDSLRVAQVFGKSHKNVIRDIEILLGDRLRSEPILEINALKSGEVNALKFEPVDDDVDSFVKLHFKASYFFDKYQRRQPMYEMTKDGFTLLVMGYTGAKAMQFKVAYINAFNEMEHQLAKRTANSFDKAEATYFARFPNDRKIRERATTGYPYWYIADKIPCHVHTVSRAVKRMAQWGMVEMTFIVANKLSKDFCKRLKIERHQQTLDF
jgi:Rha family phage regulatory protein